MNNYKLQLIETLLLILVYVLVILITKRIINNALKNTPLQPIRRKIIIKATHLFSTITALILIAGIWGLKQNEIAVFAGTILTAIGIAFFAQWSLLSNITSSIILFFNHPLKLGDTIKIMDKEFPIEGEIIDLTYFFVHLKLETGEIVTIPNSLFLQKPTSVTDK